jgi:hypothetical protein
MTARQNVLPNLQQITVRILTQANPQKFDEGFEVTVFCAFM